MSFEFQENLNQISINQVINDLRRKNILKIELKLICFQQMLALRATVEMPKVFIFDVLKLELLIMYYSVNCFNLFFSN